MTLETVEIATGPRPAAAVIWLHGLGADGHDFEPVVPELHLPASLAVRFVFPHAPVRPVTINMGMRMRAWYDVFQFGGGREDAEGIRASQLLLEGLIRKQSLPPNRIVLAGFSQGGAIALQTGLRYAERLAGILALSTYLPLPEFLAKEKSEANREIPVFMAHGRHDDIIPLARAEISRKILMDYNYPVDWHEYAMPHSVCPEEIGHIAEWLVRIL